MMGKSFALGVRFRELFALGVRFLVVPGGREPAGGAVALGVRFLVVPGERLLCWRMCW